MHAFWREQEPERQMDHINFMKNMALLGVLLFVSVQPEPWPGTSIRIDTHPPLAARWCRSSNLTNSPDHAPVPAPRRAPA
jgi:hypothetical protein